MPDTYVPGDRADFDRLYRETYPRLIRGVALLLGNDEDAEDVVQDAYISAFAAWDNWRPDAPAEAWLWRIAANKARSFQRRQRIRTVGELIRRLGRPQVSGADPQNFVTDPQLLAALRALPHREAVAVVMRHYHGFTNIEIAEALKVDVRSVTRILARGTATLRANLDRSP